MKAILLTSTFRRHVHVANTVAAGCDLAGVWQEEKTFRPERYAHDAADEAVIQRHFARAMTRRRATSRPTPRCA